MRLIGSKPDGDSVWFLPDNPELLRNIGGRSAKLNGGGFVQLRFEGIDALELHYPGSNHQLKKPTVDARDYLLKNLGFDLSAIEYAPNNNIPTHVRSTEPVFIQAHILTRGIDSHRRPISFVFKGKAPETNGSSIFLDTDRLKQSLNAALMRQGHVYPGYYCARVVKGKRVGGYQMTSVNI